MSGNAGVQFPTRTAISEKCHSRQANVIMIQVREVCVLINVPYVQGLPLVCAIESESNLSAGACTLRIYLASNAAAAAAAAAFRSRGRAMQVLRRKCGLVSDDGWKN